MNSPIRVEIISKIANLQPMIQNKKLLLESDLELELEVIEELYKHILN